MQALPEWSPGTVAVLSTGAGDPHAIPVSTGVRAGPCTVYLALALRRESLARLREDPRCALTILGAGDIAITAHARATVVEAPMAASDRVAAVRLDVERIQTTASRRSRSTTACAGTGPTPRPTAATPRSAAPWNCSPGSERPDTSAVRGSRAACPS